MTTSREEQARETLIGLLGEAGTLPPDVVLEALAYREIGIRPATMLATVLARPDAFREALLEVATASPDVVAARMAAEPDERHAYYLHTFAIYLLALWEDKRLFRPLLAYLHAAGDLAHEHLSDMVTEDLHAILARTYDGGDLAPLKAIIEDVEADLLVRDACLRSLHAMQRGRKLPREEFVAYFTAIAEGIDRHPDDELVECAAITFADLHEPALVARVRGWLASGRVDRTWIDEADLDRLAGESPERLDELLLQHERFNGLIDYICEWAWFNETDPAAFDRDFGDDGEDRPAGDPTLQESLDWAARQPVVRDGPKIGRNEACPCGSGKKYKRCCLASGPA